MEEKRKRAQRERERGTMLAFLQITIKHISYQTISLATNFTPFISCGFLLAHAADWYQIMHSSGFKKKRSSKTYHLSSLPHAWGLQVLFNSVK